MKIVPQGRAQGLFLKSCLENLNFPDAIDRYKRAVASSRTRVNFIGPDADQKKLSNAFQSSRFETRFCSSLSHLLRSGLFQGSDLFVLAGEIPAASAKDVQSILASRCERKIKVIPWENEKSVERLRESVCQAAEEMELANAKESIASDLLERSRKSAQDAEEEKADLEEDEFKDFIRKELENHLNSAPEEILSKAIRVIKG